MTRRGRELRPGDRVKLGVSHGVWTVLPFDDGIGWLGRADGSLVPIVPDDEYEMVD